MKTAVLGSVLMIFSMIWARPTLHAGFRNESRHHRIIYSYFAANTTNLPPGLARRSYDLPPGLEKQLIRNGQLPPGLQRRANPSLTIVIR